MVNRLRRNACTLGVLASLWISPEFGHAAAGGEGAAALAAEVRTKGWIVYGAPSAKGDSDLFLCRPDGSAVRNITSTPEYHEAAPQFPRDGKRLLYRRVPRSEPVDGNRYGTQGELVLANADGSSPRVFGEVGEYPWASWSPDGTQLACLDVKGIFIVHVETKKVLRRMPRKGFFQQLAWSPDGKWLCGVANSFDASWSVGRMQLDTGAINAVNRVDCCTPDWFPDSGKIIFSWRPPGQKAKGGYGWTQLWAADADGKERALVYGEDGRHVYGGCVSPDGKYVLFTGNFEENGDPGHGGAPMGLMRLADAPTIAGVSEELRALHPGTKDGPVLALPIGWEPCWTASEVLGEKPAPAGGSATTSQAPASPQSAEAARLAAEVAPKGWLVFSAMTDAGDWDLFASRPDGSARRNLTSSAATNEAGARVSPDGKKLLFFRMPKETPIDNNTYGTHELVIANTDGSGAVSFGDTFPWASWGPGSEKIACLAKSGIQIVDLASRAVVAQLPRKGIVSQLVWSPDGKWFAGTANGLGQFWAIGRVNAASGEINAVSETDRYNCTPDWAPDSQAVVYARGIVPERGGFAELWLAAGDGMQRRALYAEASRHIYGACLSPDGAYALFTRSAGDLGDAAKAGTSLALIRVADTPVPIDVAASSVSAAPRLDLCAGWEPHWTFHEIFPR